MSRTRRRRTQGRSAPSTREDPTRLDHLPPLEALRRIWTVPGPDRYAFEAMHISVRDHWPELARALDRAAAEPERPPRPVPWQEPEGSGQ